MNVSAGAGQFGGPMMDSVTRTMRCAVFEAKTSLVMRKERAALQQMWATERLPSHDLARLKAERSTAIALHAFRTTQFYREHYRDAGFTESDVAEPINFTSLPR